MLGYTSYLDKSINGIKTISDGFTVIQNGNIQTNNISTSQIDTSHISSTTGEFDNFVIGNITTDTITCTSLTLNNMITTDEFETLNNINTSTTIQSQLNNKPNLNTTNTFTQTNTFTSIQTDNINVGLSGSIGTVGAPFIATQNNQITTKKYVDDAVNGIDHSNFAILNGNNNFTGNQTILGTVDVSGGFITRGQGVFQPPVYRVDGVITTTPDFNANYFPYGDNNYTNLLCADTTVGGNFTSLYDVAALRNISCGSTIFTNNISNNTTQLGITSLSGMGINSGTNNINVYTGTMDINGSMIVRGNLTDGSSPYITQVAGDARYFVNVNNYLKGFDEITNISQPSNSTTGTIISFSAPSNVRSCINATSSIAHILNFKQPTASSSGDRVITPPYTPPLIMDGLNYHQINISNMRIDVFRDGVLFQSNIPFETNNSLSLNYTYYSYIQVENVATEPIYNTFSGVNFTFIRPITTISVKWTNPTDSVSRNYELRFIVSFTENRYYQYRQNGTNARINGASFLQYYQNSFLTNSSYTDYSQNVSIVFPSYIVAGAWSGFQDEAINTNRSESSSAPTLSEGIYRHAHPKYYSVGFTDISYSATSSIQTKCLATERISSKDTLTINSNVVIDTLYGLAYRKIILGYLFYDRTQYYALFASSKQIESIDNDVFYIIEPKVKIVLYNSPNYVSPLGQYENNGNIPVQVYSTAIYGSQRNVASIKVYYMGEEVIMGDIS